MMPLENVGHNQGDPGLLFGLVALHADYLDAGQFEEVYKAWVKEKNLSLPDVLVERGLLSVRARQEVIRLLERKLAKHHGDVPSALDELTGTTIRQTLEKENGACRSTACAGGWGQMVGYCRRRLTTQGAVNFAAAVMLAAAALAFLYPSDKPAEAPISPANDATASTVGRQDDSSKAGQLALEQGYAANMQEGQRALEAGNVDRLREILDFQQHRGSAAKDLRGFEWYYLWHQTRCQRLVIRAHAGMARGIAFSPDGKQLASGGMDNAVKLWDAITGELQSSLTVSKLSAAKLFAAGLNPPPAATVIKVAYSPTYPHVAGGSGDGQVHIWELSTGKELLAFQAHTLAINGLAYSPDGKHLATASPDKSVKVWDAATGREIMSLATPLLEMISVAYSPDGTRLASGGRDNAVTVWDVKDGKALATLSGQSGVIADLAFSPDGKWLVSATSIGAVTIWNPATGKKVASLRGRILDRAQGGDVPIAQAHSQCAMAVAFAPDGSRLASAGVDGTVRLWDPTSGQELLTLRGSPFTSMAFSRDGARLAASTSDGRIIVWEKDLPAPELRLAREAQMLVDSLFVPFVDKDDIAEQIRADKTLAEPLRKEAMARTERHRDMPRFHEDPERLNGASWGIVAQPGKERWAYRRALRQAEEAIRQRPTNGFILNTLGVAQYRVGQYREAVDSLTRSDQINRASPEAPRPGQSIPADLAFLAMAHYQLGHKDQALAVLHQLQQSQSAGPWYNDSRQAESEAFLEEAENLLKETSGGR